MKENPTYICDIYCGLRNGYSNKIHNIKHILKICKDYCNKVSLCVSISSIKFIYKKTKETGKGEEPGLKITLINYPRFPEPNEEILFKALTLARLCAKKVGQTRISVVATDKTILLEKNIDY